MVKYGRALALIALASVLSACATAPTTSYNKSANQQIKIVALAPMGLPEKPDIRILASVGGNFGLIGAIVEETRASNASKELQAIFTEQNYDYKQDIASAIESELSAAGFTVTKIDGSRPKDAALKLMKTCPKKAETDACLDVVVSFAGYMAAGASTDYLPSIFMSVKLVRNSDGQSLFQDEFQLNQSTPGSKAIVIPMPDKYRFKDRDAIKSHGPEVVAGMRDAIRAAALELAKQFK